jgi:hypothetical protein
LGEISVAEDAFRSAIAAIRDRSRIHKSEAQPKLEAANFDPDRLLTMASVMAALGMRLFAMLRDQTEHVTVLVDRGVQSVYEGLR